MGQDELENREGEAPAEPLFDDSGDSASSLRQRFVGAMLAF
jgi:hypothetical protein